MADTALPPIPFKAALISSNGLISDPWSKFFRQLFNRVGGFIALSNAELETLQATDLGTINASLISLGSRTTTLEGVVSAVDGVDFNQGPTL